MPTVFGAELSLGLSGPQNGVADHEGSHLLVLAEGQEGYHRLAGAITEAQLAGGEKGRPVYDLDELSARGRDHWVVLTGCRKGAVRQALESGGAAAGPAATDREIDQHLPTDSTRNRILADLAASRGLPVVATNNVHYANPRDHQIAAAGPPPMLPGMSEIETDMADLWSTSITTTSHPVQRLRGWLRDQGILSAAELRQAADGSRVRVAGVITHRQRPATASGVTFINLEDETGMANIVVSIGAWNANAKTARGAAAVIVTGRVQRTGQVVNLNAEKVQPLPLAAKPNHATSGSSTAPDGAASASEGAPVGEILARQASGSMSVHTVDVTDRGSVEELAETVSALLGPDALTAVVNVAGQGIAGPLELLSIDSLRHQLDVNVIAPVSVIQAVLPSLRRGRGGRIIFVGSMGGLVAVQMAGAYHASKYAIEAIGDAWRQELAPEGISVSIVEPGPIATPLWAKAVETLDRLPTSERYAERVEAFRETLRRASKNGANAAKVAALIEHAVTAPRPRTRYPVGVAAKVVPKIRRLVPDRLFEKAAQRATTKGAQDG